MTGLGVRAESAAALSSAPYEEGEDVNDDLKALLKTVRIPGDDSLALLHYLALDSHGAAPPHPGLVIQAVRRARGLTLEELVDATGYRRRGKTRTRLERLEQEGAPPSPSCTSGTRAYGTSWKQLIERAFEALEVPSQWLTDVSDRIATATATQLSAERTSSIHLQGDRWHHLSHAPLPSRDHSDERSTLGEALGFLLENRDLVARDPSLYFLRPAEALYVRNPLPPDPWSGLDRVLPPPAEPTLERPLHLGLLLELWSRGHLVLDDPRGRDPLLVLRCIRHDRLGTAVVSGIHRRSRRWGHQVVPEGSQELVSTEVHRFIEESTRDQTPLLWDRHRLRLAYELTRDRYRRQTAENPSNDLARDIPHWMKPWLGAGLMNDVERQWNHMVSALEDACLVPLTDPRWETGFPRLSWIEGRATDRWRGWLNGRGQGWSDAMLRQRAHRTFEKRLSQDIFDHVTTLPLSDALVQMRSADRGEPDGFPGVGRG